MRCGPASARWSPRRAWASCWTCRAAALEPLAPSVVLDRVQDAGNVGSILRSAAAFGFRQVLALKGTAALWSPKVLRAGMGAHFGLRLVEGWSRPRWPRWACRCWSPARTRASWCMRQAALALCLGPGP
jgi:TrmH family RNA methyltransferase